MMFGTSDRHDRGDFTLRVYLQALIFSENTGFLGYGLDRSLMLSHPFDTNHALSPPAFEEERDG